jgi:hypothetical protein
MVWIWGIEIRGTQQQSWHRTLILGRSEIAAMKKRRRMTKVFMDKEERLRFLCL